MTSLPLSELPRSVSATVLEVKTVSEHDLIAQRLCDLGFVPGETVQIQHYAPVSADPVLVQIGSTRLAIRLTEARRVLVEKGL